MHVRDTWSFSAISRVVLWRSESIIALIRSSSTLTEIRNYLIANPIQYGSMSKFRHSIYTIFSSQKFRNDIRNLDNLLVRYHPPSLSILAPWILYFVPRASSLDVLFALLSPSSRTCNVCDCWIVKGCSYCIWDLLVPSLPQTSVSLRNRNF